MMITRHLLPRLLILFFILGIAGAKGEDAWEGLDDPAESALLDGEPQDSPPDLTPLTPTPAPTASYKTPPLTPKEAENTSISDPTKMSKEEEIIGEYEAYVKKKEEDINEDRLRQRVFHEGARNNIAFDVTIDDLAKYNWGPNSDFPSSTFGFNLGYNAVPIRAKNFGRVALGLNAGIIGLNRNGANFRVAFYQIGPRASYEAKFLTAQALVPIFFIGYDRILTQIKASPSILASATESFNTFVYGAGIMINLNRIDSGTGTKSLVSTGIRKFNLALLYQRRDGDTNSRSSSFFSAGFRFEY